MSDSDKEENDEVGKDKNVILHVAVVGFHHKKGMRPTHLPNPKKGRPFYPILGTILEYSYPPLCEGETHSSSVLPSCWSCLPALALPDGNGFIPSFRDPRTTIIHGSLCGHLECY